MGEPFSIEFEHRRSDASAVSCVWRASNRESGEFISVAYSQWEMVISCLEDQVAVTVRGPETRATAARCPPLGAWVGLRFRNGASIPAVACSTLVDCAVTLPSAGARAFWLAGEAWEVPTYANADAFVARLERAGLLVHDPLVQRVLSGARVVRENVRTIQRRFVRATGLSHQAIVVTERAHAASFMLRSGASIDDTVGKLGFADQPHLTRSVRRLIGLTPRRLADRLCPAQLSFMPPLDAH